LTVGGGRGYKDAMATDPLSQDLTDQDRVLVVFAYLGPLALVSLLASRREFVKWHAKQGLLLVAALAAIYPVLRFGEYFLDRFFWNVFGELYAVGVWMIVLGVFVTMLVSIVRGLEGERFKLPLLGELADRL
jgi:uncharacterized membrane protein